MNADFVVVGILSVVNLDCHANTFVGLSAIVRTGNVVVEFILVYKGVCLVVRHSKRCSCVELNLSQGNVVCYIRVAQVRLWPNDADSRRGHFRLVPAIGLEALRRGVELWTFPVG